ncbi:hypothetical protein ACHAWT_005337 [Skeletonema menzelii]
MEQPHLLSKLRTALNYLYDSQQSHQHRHEAHQFLLTYKQSNVRRLVVSRLQSRKDKTGTADDGENELSFNHTEDLTGSIFLSCLGLLYSSCSQNSSNSHERIFTAQALNHRCRSIKLTETFDIEAEDGVECGTARLVLALEEIKHARNNSQLNNTADLNEKTKSILTAWLERYVTMLVNRCGGGSACSGADLLAVLLERHSSVLLDSPYLVDESQGEEQIKGTLMMFSLAVAMYVAAFRDFEEEHQHQNQHDEARSPWANAVLSELGSALSVTMLRLRYRPTTDKQATPSPDPSCPPLIDALVHAINIVKDSAAVYLTNQQAGGEIPSLLQDAHHYAIHRSIAACLTSLPETVLLPPGQDYMHRIPSVDRGCLRAASMELRCNETGMQKAVTVLMQSTGNVYDDSSASRLLGMCEAWARYVAVPIHVIDESVGKVAVQFMHISKGTPALQQQKVQSLAFQYLVSIFEAALPTLSVSDILTAALGVGATGVQNGKKKQGNKSKKRHDKRLDRAKAVEDESSQNQAEEELLARKNAACAAAAAAFGVSTSSAGDDWGLRLASSCPTTTSHAICSTVAAAATSVLPHLLWLERNDGPSQQWRSELFSVITTVIQRMCKAEDRDIRALVYEALMIIHGALNSVTVVSCRVEQLAIDSICECVLSLSASCAYPLNYFDNLFENNDEDLEIERNDVRDVCRSVCSLDSGNFGSDESKSPSLMILNRIVSACHSAIKGTDPAVSPSEAVVHALSSLAKPLNKLGNKCLEVPDEEGCTILSRALDSFAFVFQILNSSIERLPHSQTLPLSRLVLIGFASLAPLLSSVARMALRSTTEAERNLIEFFEKSLCYGIQQAILSTAQIPELVAESTLESTRYDIKGAMRGPGGEDHVGCIALIRVSSESDELRNSVFKVCGGRILQDLTNLHHTLKRIEVERGVGVDYGKGVTPLSRRLLIRVVSRLGIQQGDGTVLHSLLEEPLREIVAQKSSPVTIEKLFRFCEAALDLSFFSPELLSHLFRDRTSDLDSLFQTVIMGYAGLSFTSEGDATTHHWARLRCGIICLLRACQSMTDYSAGVIRALIRAECEAAAAQCDQGPSSGSNLFVEDIIGEEKIHTGAYVILIGEYLKHLSSSKVMTEDQVASCRRCVQVLKHCASDVASVLLHVSPEASAHVDPRVTLAEAWFLTMKTLASVCRHNDQIISMLATENVQTLFGESLSVAMLFIFMKDIGGKKRPAPDMQQGMSPDGPQTLAISDFIAESMLLGPSILAGSIAALSAHIQINCGNEVPAEVLGGAAISASLLRAISGATPPWVVEDTPVLFKAMHTALGNDSDLFIQALGVSTKLETMTAVGGLRAGEKLSGRYLDASDSHINSFLGKAAETVAKNDWKKMKVVLKSATGGKKKESGFNLKPHYSNWECERV